jgi:hypothetical protein
MSNIGVGRIARPARFSLGIRAAFVLCQALTLRALHADSRIMRHARHLLTGMLVCWRRSCWR